MAMENHLFQQANHLFQCAIFDVVNCRVDDSAVRDHNAAMKKRSNEPSMRNPMGVLGYPISDREPDR
jgi:hypothetical protein